MGCTSNHTPIYNESRHTEEKGIQEWEDNLGFKKINFFDLVSALNSKTYMEGGLISLKKFKHFIHQQFDKYFDDQEHVFNIIRIFENEYFNADSSTLLPGQTNNNNNNLTPHHNNNKYQLKHSNSHLNYPHRKIDCMKVKYVFFLLCHINETPSAAIFDIDKAEFIYTIVKDNEGDAGDEISRDTLQLDIYPLLKISCEILPEMYIKSKDGMMTNDELYLREMDDDSLIDEIREKLLDEMCGVKDKITLNDLSEKFMENPSVSRIINNYVLVFNSWVYERNCIGY
jgi:hypothetical protein